MVFRISEKSNFNQLLDTCFGYWGIAKGANYSLYSHEMEYLMGIKLPKYDSDEWTEEDEDNQNLSDYFQAIRTHDPVLLLLSESDARSKYSS